MFDLKVHEFKQQMIANINNSDLPLSVLHYIMKDIEAMVGEALTKQLEMEKTQQMQNVPMDIEPGLVDIDMNEGC